MVLETTLTIISIIAGLTTIISEVLPYSKCEGNGILHFIELKLTKFRVNCEK